MKQKTKMRKLFLFLIFFALPTTINAKEIYKIDSSHANIVWKASHFGFSKPSGKFSDIIGIIELNKNDLQNSKVNIKIKSESITTGLKSFDNHLKGPDFFNVKKFPIITFTSSAISQYNKKSAKIKGYLNMLGHKEIVTLDMKINKEGINPINNKKTIGFSGKTLIKRSKFKMDFSICRKATSGGKYI